MSELETLARAHQLFAGPVAGVSPLLATDLGQSGTVGIAPENLGRAAKRYRERLAATAALTGAANRTDAVLARTLLGAKRDHAAAQLLTGQVLDQARADARRPPGDSPLAQREAIRRRAARLRTQHGYVLTARHRASRRLAILRALRYRLLRRALRSGRLRLPDPDSRAAYAVRAALTRLGRPYVWGATGPDQFDCSGLVQWAYGQAGVQLGRTTYDQIDDGVPVARSQVRPGDLVFPNSGHVQIAIGNGQVVEAPHAGATVRISPLGADVVIRRPLP